MFIQMDFFTNYLKGLKILTKKPTWASLCNLAYTDKEKRRYFIYNDEMDMCIIRKGEIEKYLMELQYGSNYEDVLKAMKEALSMDKKGQMQPDIMMLGYLIQELISRKEFLLLPEIMFKIMATMLIREDENPYIIDQEIMEEKLKTFESELQHGGLASFFHSDPMLSYLNLSGISMIDLKGLMNESRQKIENLNLELSSFRNELQLS